MENLDVIMETFEPDANDTLLETFIFKMAEENQPEGKKFLDELTPKRTPEKKDEKIFNLTQAYTKMGFAVGYIYGQMFDLCHKEAADLVALLKQKLVDEELLNFQARGKKKPETSSEKQNNKALVGDAAYSILAIATVGEEAYHPNGETWAPGKLFQIIKREAQTITDSL